jgi:hypothetical protein
VADAPPPPEPRGKVADLPATTSAFIISGYVPSATNRQQVADLMAAAIDAAGDLSRPVFVRVGIAAGLPAADAPNHQHLMAVVLVAARMSRAEVEDVLLQVKQAVDAAWSTRWGEDTKPAGLPVEGRVWAQLRGRATHWSHSRCDDPELEAAARILFETPAGRLSSDASWG